MEASERWLALLATCLVALVMFMAMAAFKVRGQEHRHPPEHQSLHERFYKTWTMPTNRAVSCCHDEDCKPAEAYMKNGQWYARHEGDTGDFTPIPQNKVDMGLPDSPEPPDMRAHLCGRRYGFTGGEFTVFCFIAGSGG